MRTPRILIIAGSDSGGGAGIQADIKTVSALGGHAMTAITAITAQNTLRVSAVHPVPTAMVLAQIDAVIDDIGVDAVKIGMIGSAGTADAVAARLERLIDIPIVFDPVMVATSGAALADDATVAAFGRLMRIATIVTPNGPELAALAGRTVAGPAEAIEAAKMLVERYGCSVLAKGGHFPGDLVDSLVDFRGGLSEWSDERIESRSTHGTGCTLASGIAIGLAQGLLTEEAVGRARAFVRAAMMAAPGLGAGHGPMGQGLVRVRASH